MLGWEPQVHRERGQVVGDTGDRCGVAGLPLGGEPGGLALGGGDRRIAGSASPTSKMAQQSAFTSAWSCTDTLARVLRAR
jgi:hypothetical protein